MNTKYIKWLELTALAILIFCILSLATFQALNLDINNDYQAGVTYSRPYAEELELDPDQTLTAILDDLQVRHFRIPAYWNLLQPTRNNWDWEWLDKDLDAIAERNGTVTLAIGHKLPRWPECWTPAWARHFDEQEQEQAVLAYLDAVIDRYKDHPAVVEWQVENEANFPFGQCPQISNSFIDKEINFVKSKNTGKPIVTTDSGELTLWDMGKHVDQLGVSVYRVVLSPIGVFHYWFIPPQFYLRKGQLAKIFYGTSKVYVSELQMEPWVKTTILKAPLSEQEQTFNLDQMQANINFAAKMGLDRIDFWGVEWWYWMKTANNDNSYWELAKTIFQKNVNQ
ncbi:beta-galactosidase [Patescibacteria group bacterium]|nr:beta-galactosidase [Patescibacteria group bacterium]